MTKAVAQLVDDNFGGPEALPLMHRQAKWLFVGRLSYWLFVYAVLALIAIVYCAMWGVPLMGARPQGFAGAPSSASSGAVCGSRPFGRR